MKLRVILIILGIAIAVIPYSVFALLSEKVVVGEQLCVDGNNNINLAGIMCEDSEFTVNGIDDKTARIIQWTTIVIGLLMYMIGMFASFKQDAISEENE